MGENEGHVDPIWRGGYAVTYRILIVEDQRDIARMLRESIYQYFGRDKVEVVDVPSAEEALLEVLQRMPHLVLVDLGLPGLPGHEFIRRLRRLRPGVPVIVTTAWSRQHTEEALRGLKVDALFYKPFTPGDVLEQIERSLEGDTASAKIEAARLRATERLNEILVDVLKQFYAYSVALVDDEGRIVLTAGESVDETFWDQIRGTLLAMISSSNKISRILQAEYSQAFHLCRGAEEMYLLRAVDDHYWLWILLPPQETVQWVLRLGYLDTAAEEIRESLIQMGLVASPAEVSAVPETSPLEIPQDLELPDQVSEAEADRLFGMVAEEEGLQVEPMEALPEELLPPPPDEAERFWEEVAATSEGEGDLDPDVLTYEQAKRLGLVPQEPPDIASPGE